MGAKAMVRVRMPPAMRKPPATIENVGNAVATRGAAMMPMRRTRPPRVRHLSARPAPTRSLLWRACLFSSS